MARRRNLDQVMNDQLEHNILSQRSQLTVLRRSQKVKLHFFLPCFRRHIFQSPQGLGRQLRKDTRRTKKDTMFSSQKRKTYSSVPSNDDYDNHDDDDDDDSNYEDDDGSSDEDDVEHSRGQNAPSRHHRHRRRRPPPSRIQRKGSSSSCCSSFFSTCLLLLGGIGAVLAILLFVDQSSQGNNSFLHSTEHKGQTRLSLFLPSSSSSSNSLDQATMEQVQAQAKSITSNKKHLVHYNPAVPTVNPFDFATADTTGGVFHPPGLLRQDPSHGGDNENDNEEMLLGFFKQPHVVNNHIVFCSEGDAFVTTIPPTTTTRTISPLSPPSS